MVGLIPLLAIWSTILDANPAGPSVLYGVAIEGPVPYSRNADVSFTPASDTKLFTTWAALTSWGADHQFETELKWQDVEPGVITHLTLVGSGDPSWGLSQLGEDARTRVDSFVAELKSKGVSEVRGPVHAVANDPRWNHLAYPEGWDPPKNATSCDTALAQAFNVMANCATFRVTSPSHGAWAEKEIPVPVSLNIREGRHTSLTVDPVFKDGVAMGFLISGTWARREGAQDFSLPVNDASGWVEKLLTRSLSENGILMNSKEPELENTEWQSLNSKSPRLGEILKPFLKDSINLVGDALSKILGQEKDRSTEDLFAAGAKAVLQTLPPDIAAHVEFQDGSGMSHLNHTTPDAMLGLLKIFPSHPDFPYVWDSLPIAGVDGTLAGRMKSTPAENILRAKTGTLDGSYNLSGYVPHGGEQGRLIEYVPFVIFSSTTTEGEAKVIHAQDVIGAELARLVLKR
jgi:D-alanyl-D-alanine carboxypeptidase/D-alanyl-D-alanine-endopeptidase (penicillin-binding protein 4)